MSADEDSEEDFDWEEVAVPVPEHELPAEESNSLQEGPSTSPSERRNIEITLQARPKVDDSAKCVTLSQLCHITDLDESVLQEKGRCTLR